MILIFSGNNTLGIGKVFGKLKQPVAQLRTAKDSAGFGYLRNVE